MEKLQCSYNVATDTKTHRDAIDRVIDRMLSGPFNPRSLNPEDDIIDAIDKRAAWRRLLQEVPALDLVILSLLLEGFTIREMAGLLRIPKSTIHYHVKRMNWARPLLEPSATHSDPALLGECYPGLHRVKRRGAMEEGYPDHSIWKSLGNGGYRARGGRARD